MPTNPSGSSKSCAALRDRGLTIIYVSHRLEEVFSICDRITVIRDGQYQGTWATGETTIPKIITQMVGRRIEESFPARRPLPGDAPAVLSVKNLAAEPALKDVSFELRAGEILGFAGLEGSGIDEIFDVLFGLRTATSGSIAYSDGRPAPASPFQAIKQRLALVPANRRDEGLLTSWSIRYNASLPVLDRLLFALGVIDRKAEGRMARDYVKRLNIVTDSVDKRVVNLSGGNQQKVVPRQMDGNWPDRVAAERPDPRRGRRGQGRDLSTLRRTCGGRNGLAVHLIGNRGNDRALRSRPDHVPGQFDSRIPERRSDQGRCRIVGLGRGQHRSPP